jgi:3-hydroxyisobutyrate dehydrogenase-like beta-hydroxyacid dehydrogenase
MRTIGVLGLGIIGLPWARRYNEAGRLVGAWNRTPKADVPCWMDSPRKVAAAADATHIVVADPPAVSTILDAILPALGPGKAVVQSSTIDPASAAEFEARVCATGAIYVESPFTGSKLAAESGNVVFFMGGKAAGLEAVDPLLALVSQARFRLADVRQSATLKLAMNLNIAAQMEALSESLTFAQAAGIDSEFFFQALSKTVAQSGLATLKKDKLRTLDYSPQFSVKHMHKDMRLAAAVAQGKLPLLDTVRGCLAKAEQQGMGDDDFSSLIRLLG